MVAREGGGVGKLEGLKEKAERGSRNQYSFYRPLEQLLFPRLCTK